MKLSISRVRDQDYYNLFNKFIYSTPEVYEVWRYRVGIGEFLSYLVTDFRFHSKLIWSQCQCLVVVLLRKKKPKFGLLFFVSLIVSLRKKLGKNSQRFAILCLQAGHSKFITLLAQKIYSELFDFVISETKSKKREIGVSSKGHFFNAKYIGDTFFLCRNNFVLDSFHSRI